MGPVAPPAVHRNGRGTGVVAGAGAARASASVADPLECNRCPSCPGRLSRAAALAATLPRTPGHAQSDVISPPRPPTRRATARSSRRSRCACPRTRARALRHVLAVEARDSRTRRRSRSRPVRATVILTRRWRSPARRLAEVPGKPRAVAPFALRLPAAQRPTTSSPALRDPGRRWQRDGDAALAADPAVVHRQRDATGLRPGVHGALSSAGRSPGDRRAASAWRWRRATRGRAADRRRPAGTDRIPAGEFGAANCDPQRAREGAISLEHARPRGALVRVERAARRSRGARRSGLARPAARGRPRCYGNARPLPCRRASRTPAPKTGSRGIRRRAARPICPRKWRFRARGSVGDARRGVDAMPEPQRQELHVALLARARAFAKGRKDEANGLRGPARDELPRDCSRDADALGVHTDPRARLSPPTRRRQANFAERPTSDRAVKLASRPPGRVGSANGLIARAGRRRVVARRASLFAGDAAIDRKRSTRRTARSSGTTTVCATRRRTAPSSRWRATTASTRRCSRHRAPGVALHVRHRVRPARSADAADARHREAGSRRSSAQRLPAGTQIANAELNTQFGVLLQVLAGAS